MAKIKHLKKLFRGVRLRGALGGFGNAAVAALGWKIASDVYDAVKRRVRDDGARERPSEQDDS